MSAATATQASPLAREGSGAERARAFLETNLKALDIPPQTRQRVLESEPKGELRRLRDGTPALKLGTHHLGSPFTYDELRARLRGCDERCVVVVFGLGSGVVPRAVRAHCKSPIIVYEPDAGLLRRTLEYGPLDLGGIPIVCSTRDLSKAWYDASRQEQLALVLASPGYAQDYADELGRVSDVVRALVQRVTITKNTYTNRGRVWIEDIIENAGLLRGATPFLALAERYRGVPAFIVGAGPSLDKNIDQLREASRKGIVFATNSSASALAARGIEPQVLICIESIDVSHKLRDLPFMDRVVRAFSLSAAPGTLRTGGGPLLTIHESVPQYAGPLLDLTGVAGLPACGSVSTAALSLAFRLGCSPLVLVGQDLAYSGGKTYASGTGYEASRAEIKDERGLIELKWSDGLRSVHGEGQGKRHEREPLEWRDAWGGEGRVPTGPSFTAVHSWFEGSAALLKEAGQTVRLINATEGGARIAGFEELELADVVRELPAQDITSASLAAQAFALCPPLGAEHILQWFGLQLQGARAARRAARRVRRLADHARRVTGRAAPTLVTRAYARLERAEFELKRAVAQAPFVDAWAHNPVRAVLESDEHKQGSNDDTAGAQRLAEQSTKKSAQVARAVEEAARQLEQALAEGARRIARSEAGSQGEGVWR